jgi:ubiquinone/menaquinone biosynthesis C-methylase UbiE
MRKGRAGTHIQALTRPRGTKFSLDVGCGFTEGVQIPVYAEVSLDLNMNRVEPSFLKKLKENNSNPVCASATNLPFRAEVFERVHWRAILEHLPRNVAREGIEEGVRVLKENGEAEVILPIITAHMKHYLVILFTQFPFSIYTILTALYRANKYWKIEGVPHLTIIKPYHFEKYFKEVLVKKIMYRNKWFHSPWSRITNKLVNGRYISDIQGQFYIRCFK